jgi:protoporphyrinogen oxidase
VTDTSSTSSPAPSDAPRVVIAGAGPAGLTAAYELCRAGVTSTVLEADRVVGGISRTVERDGWRFDIGGHRFFTKVPEVEALWHEILPDEDFLLRPRLSRIFYQGKYFDYPLKAMNALKNLGLVEAVLCVLSYAWARVRPPKDQTNYEGWLVARFGWRLYRTFFKTYTEKVWGVPVSSMPADWAAQRIKNLSLMSAIVNALTPNRNQKEITSLIEEFQYPKYGPGMMWERCTEQVEAQGTEVRMMTKVVGVKYADGRAHTVVTEDRDGSRTELPADHVISSMPFPHLIRAMDPPAPAEVLAAADDLQFRDFLTIALVVPESAGFPDNWIYIHAPEVKVGRIQNFGSWSPYLVKDGRTCLGLEYFVFEGDELWNAKDEDLIEMGAKELGILGLVDPSAVQAGYVVRMPKAYPTYDEFYRKNVEVMREWLESAAPNVHPVGRNGMHKYNNADHSMFTAMLTVQNILGQGDHDIWAVNVEEEYHEESSSTGSGSSGTGRDAPVIPRDAPRA